MLGHRRPCGGGAVTDILKRLLLTLPIIDNEASRSLSGELVWDVSHGPAGMNPTVTYRIEKFQCGCQSWLRRGKLDGVQVKVRINEPCLSRPAT